MKKRIAALAMAGLMVFGAVGCGPKVSTGGEKQETEASTEKKEKAKC